MKVTKHSGSAGDKTQRETAKKGPRLAVLVGLIDLGIQVVEYQGEKKKPCRQVLPVFHLLNDKYTDQNGVEQCMVTSPYSGFSIMPGADRSKYMKFCNAIDPNHEVMDADGTGDLEDLLGRNCFVNMKHNEKEGITYANYVDCSELPEDYPCPVHIYESVFFDTENPDQSVWDKLWDRTKDAIRGMEEYGTSKVKVMCDGGTATPPLQGESKDEEERPY